MDIKVLIDSLPKPISYLKAVIAGDTNVRVAAFLAVIAGIALVAGYLTLLIALVFEKSVLTAFITVNAAMVALATFSKVDTNNTSTVNITDKPDNKPKLDNQQPG